MNPSRTLTAAVAAAVALTATACAATSPAPTATTPVAVATPPPDNPAAPAAAAVLATLPIRNADPLGYHRDAFGTPWYDADGNNCDTRNDVLRRDLTDPAVRASGTGHGCIVDSGVLHDPYTGAETTFTRGASTSSAVQIDHVVPLADAWRSGANTWTDDQRRAFANNLANLLAVKGSINTSKGDKRADEWLPPRAEFRCRYIAIQVTIKANPGPGLPPLTVSEPERRAMADVLARCGGEPARGAP